MYLESAEKAGWTQKCDVQRQSADGRRLIITDVVAVDLPSDGQFAAAGVNREIFTARSHTKFVRHNCTIRRVTV